MTANLTGNLSENWDSSFTFLAQGGVSNFLNLPEPPPLPEASLLERYLFEQPIPLTLLFVVAGGICWTVLNSRARLKQAWRALWCCLGLGALVVVVSFLVTTSREKVMEATASLVRAVSRADATATGSLLASDARLYFTEGGIGVERDVIIARVGKDFAQGGMYHLQDCSILERRAGVIGSGLAVCQVRVRSTPSVSGGPIFSWWRVDYEQGTDGVWRVKGIMMLSNSLGAGMRGW